jgi:putative oxidoreductase
MSTTSISIPTSADAWETGAFGRATVLAGRTFFSLIFIMAALGHFTQAEIGYAAQAGVPLASIAVPLSGVIALAGGLSILLGYQARLGAWLLVLFLVPVTVMMHNFWAMKDVGEALMHQAMFFKNVGLMGGALLITQFGAGPWSLDSRKIGRQF